jgi:hypothetical protein
LLLIAAPVLESGSPNNPALQSNKSSRRINYRFILPLASRCDRNLIVAR